MTDICRPRCGGRLVRLVAGLVLLVGGFVVCDVPYVRAAGTRRGPCDATG